MFIPLKLPGAPELLVILLIFLVLVGLPVGVVLLLRRRRRRTEALTERVDELESQLDATEEPWLDRATQAGVEHQVSCA